MPLPLGWLVQIQAPASRAAGGFEFCNVPGDAVGWNPWWALLSWRLGWRCAALVCWRRGGAAGTSADVAAAVGVPSSLDFGVSRGGCVRDSCGRALKSCRAQWVWDRSRWHLGDCGRVAQPLWAPFSHLCVG